ncbi:PA3496 family putative envelope integrity protein [Thiopseudomonas acetoxidans]|uniref:Leucyl-tRNA synthetase n=1 Tax=Thiopseudomonas acetoxidans TaxID=3041622 RepID=A0ABT7SP94_9GAMM|nr:hypothetical protein [Thiopseudomonas sp. CY1220]MDM7858013.1 hypothetical protein [Thiopseudomonas sp. CY1220]
MSKEELELDDDFVDDEEVSIDDAEVIVEESKNTLTKRRIIDNLLEERRLNKELSDYDYELD